MTLAAIVVVRVVLAERVTCVRLAVLPLVDVVRVAVVMLVPFVVPPPAPVDQLDVEIPELFCVAEVTAEPELEASGSRCWWSLTALPRHRKSPPRARRFA